MSRMRSLSRALPCRSTKVGPNLTVGAAAGGAAARQALHGLLLPAPPPVPRFKSWEHVRRNVHDPHEVRFQKGVLLMCIGER